MRKTVTLLLVLVSLFAWVLGAGAQEEDIDAYRRQLKKAREVLEEKEFEPFLKLFGNEDTLAQTVFRNAVEEMRQNGKSAVQMLPYYEFYHKRWGIYGDGSALFFDLLTEGRFLVSKAKAEWKDAQLCDKIASLMNEKRIDEALSLLRSLPEDHGKCEMCAMNFGKILLYEVKSAEDAVKKTPLAEEMLTHFPECVNAQIAVKELAGRIDSNSDYWPQACDLREKLLKVTKLPALRRGILPDVARHHSYPREGENVSLQTAIKCYEELVSLAKDKDWKQDYLYNIAEAQERYADKLANDALRDKNEKAAKEAYRGIAQAFLRAFEFDPKSKKGYEAAAAVITSLSKEGKFEEGGNLALGWCERAQKD
jgi:hypothetical protein